MIKKCILFILLFYFATLAETSFLVHFNLFGKTLNLVMIIVIIWNLLENQKHYSGIHGAIIGGLFLDIFSSRLIGFNILILLLIALFIKFILKKYVRVPIGEKT